MIQFNLIPSIKKEFLQAQRLKRIVILLASITTGLSFAVAAILFVYVSFFQMNDLNKIDQTVQTRSNILEGNSNLNKILTVQNQLASLPSVESNLPVVSRLFTFINQFTPVNATISSFNVDLGQDTFVISGAADSLQTVNQFIDTLKFTNYGAAGTTSSSGPAFSGVVLGSFSYSSAATAGQNANYTINLSFNPAIFSSSSNIVLQVPNLITTRSILDQPSNIFVKQVTK